MYPHRIRLRGPWECDPLGSDVRSFRETMPCRWSSTPLAGFSGRVRCRRHFGYPGRLDGDERVWLKLAGLGDVERVVVNGTVLAERCATPFDFDVTHLLLTRNVLEMDVTPGEEWGEVALEVRATAFLTAIAVHPEGDHLRVTGTVGGTADGLLELYVLLEGRHAHYTTVTAGSSFNLNVALPSDVPTPNGIQVDLVNGATIWYTVRMDLTAQAAATD